MSGLTARSRRAINKGLEAVMHVRPDRYDADALYGALLEAGITLLDPGDFDPIPDRCDFECPICNPEPEEARA